MDPSVNIFKMILESSDGKKWFAEYLKTNLRTHICLGNDYLEVLVSFNGDFVTQSSCRLLIQFKS